MVNPIAAHNPAVALPHCSHTDDRGSGKSNRLPLPDASPRDTLRLTSHEVRSSQNGLSPWTVDWLPQMAPASGLPQPWPAGTFISNERWPTSLLPPQPL